MGAEELIMPLWGLKELAGARQPLSRRGPKETPNTIFHLGRQHLLVPCKGSPAKE